MEAAANALQGKLSDTAEKRITVQLVQKVVARQNNMSVQQLLERTRRHSIARPRQIAMFLASKMTHASLPDIGQRFGGFDHTTVMYARDRIADLVEKDPTIKAEIEGLTRAIRREPSGWRRGSPLTPSPCTLRLGIGWILLVSHPLRAATQGAPAGGFCVRARGAE